eukprot:2456134-Amphidinium_carterae.1
MPHQSVLCPPSCAEVAMPLRSQLLDFLLHQEEPEPKRANYKHDCGAALPMAAFSSPCPSFGRAAHHNQFYPPSVRHQWQLQTATIHAFLASAVLAYCPNQQYAPNSVGLARQVCRPTDSHTSVAKDSLQEA